MTEPFESTQPIYTQLAEKIKRRILRGELQPGAKLPSVREMGIEVSVNPNTVQRTYRELEVEGVVETRRGQGTFVTEHEQVLHYMKDELKQKEISHFVQGMHDMGYSNEEIEAGLKAYLQAEKGESAR